MDSNEAYLEDVQNELLPSTAEEIDEQAIDEEDQGVLEEIVEQNIILKVLEKELQQ